MWAKYPVLLVMPDWGSRTTKDETHSIGLWGSAGSAHLTPTPGGFSVTDNSHGSGESGPSGAQPQVKESIPEV